MYRHRDSRALLVSTQPVQLGYGGLEPRLTFPSPRIWKAPPKEERGRIEAIPATSCEGRLTDGTLPGHFR